MKQHATKAVYAGLALLVSLSKAAQITVDVGASGFVFTPDTVTANAGDVIEFVLSSGHNVAQSSFDNPCQPIGSSAIFSGFASNGAVFSVTVDSSDTLWFYCAASGHCEGGMAMVVNPPSSGDTLAAYKSAARNAAGSSPSQVQGGTFGTPASSSSASPSSSQSSSSSESPSSSQIPTPSPTPSPPPSLTTTSTLSTAPAIVTSVIPSSIPGPPTGSPTGAPPATFTGHGEALGSNLVLLSLVILGGWAINM